MRRRGARSPAWPPSPADGRRASRQRTALAVASHSRAVPPAARVPIRVFLRPCAPRLECPESLRRVPRFGGCRPAGLAQCRCVFARVCVWLRIAPGSGRPGPAPEPPRRRLSADVCSSEGWSYRPQPLLYCALAMKMARDAGLMGIMSPRTIQRNSFYVMIGCLIALP